MTTVNGESVNEFIVQCLKKLTKEQMDRLEHNELPILVITREEDGDMVTINTAVAEVSEFESLTAAFKHCGSFSFGIVIGEWDDNSWLHGEWVGVLRHDGVIEEITPGQQVN